MSNFWLSLLQQALLIFLPALAVVGFLWLSALAVKEWKYIVSKYPKFQDLIDEFAPQVVAAAEQMRKAGLLPTGAEAKVWAIKTLQGILDAHGASIVQVAPIEAAIEEAVGELPPFIFSPEPTATVTPVLESKIPPVV